MAAPSIRPIRNCLYGRHIRCTRRHRYQPVSRALAFRRGALVRAARAHIVERQRALAFRRGALVRAARAHTVERTSGCKYFILSNKVHAENFSRRCILCVCIATAVDFSIQVQMNQWKIVWLLVWIKCDILSGVVLYLVTVYNLMTQECQDQKQVY